MGEEAKIIPESVLKKSEDWALAKSHALSVKKQKDAENIKLIFKNAEKYAKEYRE